MQWKGIRKMPDYRFKHGRLRYPTLVRNLFHFLMKFILGQFFWGAVHGPVRSFHGLIRSFHGPVRPFHGLSMVCPRVIFFRNIYLKNMQESAILFNPPNIACRVNHTRVQHINCTISTDLVICLEPLFAAHVPSFSLIGPLYIYICGVS